MTTILEDVIARVKTWPSWRHQDAVDLLETLEESGTDVYPLSESGRSAVREGLESRAVSDAELRAFRSRHDT